jgi:pre-sodorifen synthase
MTAGAPSSDVRVDFEVVRGPNNDPYEAKVVETYADDPEMWRKALGEHILFQWGVYDHPDSPRPVSLDEAGIRYFDRQLELAGLADSESLAPQRILDVGCGWGFIMRYLAQRFPRTNSIEGLSVSARQLEYCAQYFATHGLRERTRLYLCNARDISLLPDPDKPFDLVVVRGVISHFPPETFRVSMAALAQRMRPGGVLVVSENLYNIDPDSYESAIPDEVDRLACRHRKTPRQVTETMTENGFTVNDLRVLPSNTDVAHWLLEVRSNIETHFPDIDCGPLADLRVLAVNLSIALLRDQVSAYSIIARRT